MTNKPKNPPAFPHECVTIYAGGGESESAEQGMSLRDYFAGQALAGICADGGHGLTFQHEVARAAYECADEMLREREK